MFSVWPEGNPVLLCVFIQSLLELLVKLPHLWTLLQIPQRVGRQRHVRRTQVKVFAVLPETHKTHVYCGNLTGVSLHASTGVKSRTWVFCVWSPARRTRLVCRGCSERSAAESRGHLTRWCHARVWAGPSELWTSAGPAGKPEPETPRSPSSPPPERHRGDRVCVCFTNMSLIWWLSLAGTFQCI